MKQLKECITAYMSMALGGSGIAFIAMGILSNSEPDYLAAGFVAPILSIVNSLILAILFYKCASHNRYAGYCKLLSQEMFLGRESLTPGTDFSGWEYCIPGLRRIEVGKNRQSLFTEAGKAKIGGVENHLLYLKLKRLLGPKAKVDRNDRILGRLLIAETLRGRERAHSWGFPIYIAIVFLALTSMYLLMSFYFIAHVAGSRYGLATKLIPTVLFVAVLWFQWALWGRFAAWLYRLMRGSSSVDAYCWKLLPLRYQLALDIGGKSLGYSIRRLSGFDFEGEGSPWRNRSGI